MNNYFINILKSLNLNKLEKFFFALFLLSIPLQTRLTFITPQTYLFGQFNEYATFFIYLSDIFLITTFLLCFVNPVRNYASLNKNNSSSTQNHEKNQKQTYNSNRVNILTKHNKFSINLKTFSTSPHIIPILFFLFLWVLIISFFAEYRNIAFYQNFKLLEYILLSIYVAKKLSWFGLTRFASLIFIAGALQSIIGIIQYLNQSSLGLKILGESDLSPKIDNVAKIFINGERFIRAYGTFPHPNVFAAFLIFSITITIWLILFAKTKQKNQIVSRETISANAEESKAILSSVQEGQIIITNMQKIKIYILTIGILLQSITLMLTFSRIAWLGMVLSFIIIALNTIYIYIWKQNIKIVSRETILINTKTNIRNFWNYTLNKVQKTSFIAISIGFIIIIAIFWNQINDRTLDTENNYQQAISYRELYNKIAIKIIYDHPIAGIGNGNFTLVMKNYSPVTLEWWQFQPAHNIYLLIASESGIFGLIIFIIFVFTILKKTYLKQNNQNVSRETFSANAKKDEIILHRAKTNKTFWLNNFMIAIFISFLIMALFDHYFWTLQQGRLIFWLTIGILLSFQNQSFLPSKSISRKNNFKVIILKLFHVKQF